MWTAIWIGVGLLVWAISFLALREVVLWYFRVPEQVKLMEDIRDELRAMNANGTQSDEPSVFAWRDRLEG